MEEKLKKEEKLRKDSQKREEKLKKESEELKEKLKNSTKLEDKLEQETARLAAAVEHEEYEKNWCDSALGILGSYEYISNISYAEIVVDVLKKKPFNMTINAMEEMMQVLASKDIPDKNEKECSNVFKLKQYGVDNEYWYFNG